MVPTAAKRPKRDTVNTAARLRKQQPSGIVGRVTYTADYVSQLPQDILERASQLLKGCWPKSRPIECMITSLLEGQGSVELHSAFKAASGVGFRSGDKASSEQLQLRLALLWVGDVVTACCLYTNSHEAQREVPQHVRPSREQSRERRTEIVLFGVQRECRRQRVGSALLAYVTYLANVRPHPLTLSAPSAPAALSAPAAPSVAPRALRTIRTALSTHLALSAPSEGSPEPQAARHVQQVK